MRGVCIRLTAVAVVTACGLLSGCGNDAPPRTAASASSAGASSSEDPCDAVSQPAPTNNASSASDLPASLPTGVALDPEHLRGLPPQGIAVQVGGTKTVVLVALDGTVIGHLDGFSFTPDGMDNRYLHSGGPLVLGHADHFATLSAPADERRLTDTPDPPGSVPLTGGAELVPATVGRSACLRRADGVVSRLEPGAIDVSADGQWVTTRQVGGNSYTSGTAHNVTSSDVVRFDSDCFIGNDSPVGRVDICGDTLRINRATGSPLDVMTPGGHHLWTAAAVSPDGKTVLAQRSAECESQSAWLVPLDKPDPTPQLAGPPGTEWDSAGMGWLDDGHAIISYGPGICGTALPAGPGVYSLDPGDGSLRPIYPVPADISAWGALLWNDG